VTAPIAGILTPHMVPLDSQGRIDEDELARLVDWLIGKGVHGLYPNGSTGEFLRFTVGERRRIVEITCKAAAGRVPVVAGAAEANVAETLAACEHCLDCSARAVSIVAPFYYRLPAESVYAYFAAIARDSPIDVTLYNIPMLASPIDTPTVVRLAAEFPRIVGIKDSSGDVAQMIRLLAAVRAVRPEFAVLTGWEGALVPMILAGCDGGTHATSAVVPELTRAAFDAAKAGDVTRANELQRRITRVFDLVFGGAEFPEGFRVATGVRGFRMGPSRQPATADQHAARARLADRVRQMLVAEGIDGVR
jgi:4-hydroxy-tetrahydrodipicolinate synthase